MPFSALPEDILYDVTGYLDPHELLALCRSCHALYDNESIRLSPSYWSAAARTTFRVPNRPAAAGDGRRWMQLYRRMRTQTKAYAWGQGTYGCLGSRLPDGRSAHESLRLRASWPRETNMTSVGVIADLQCGGWSTTALTSHGQLYTLGGLDGRFQIVQSHEEPAKLTYPEGFAEPSARNAVTAIAEFSSGRHHVLGLSDSGRIWSWGSADRPGVYIKFLDIDLVEHAVQDTRRRGTVTKVVAGWGKSSALVVGTGLVCWNPSISTEVRGGGSSDGDCMMVLDPWIVPQTGFVRETDQTPASDTTLQSIGEVTSWVLLEDFLVFCTDTGGIFTRRITDVEDFAPTTRLDTHNDEGSGDVIDIQGQFRTFAIIMRSGEVLIGHQDYLIFKTSPTSIPSPIPQDAENNRLQKIPCLQNSGVIAFAFGDWHFHALHSDGTITSYGKELSRCGSLGLGTDRTRGGGLRGVTSEQFDFKLPEDCLSSGRRVNFEPEKLEWLQWLVPKRQEAHEARERFEALAHNSARHASSEWVELRLCNWESDAPKSSIQAPSDVEGDGLPAYFALSVAAGGWHSGALVLVNEEKAQRVRERYRVQQNESFASSAWKAARSWVSQLAGTSETSEYSQWVWEVEKEVFPRLKLRDGTVLPGEANVVELPESLLAWRPTEWVDL